MSAGIIDYVENTLQFSLYPVQKLVLKLIHGVPLDNQTKFLVRKSDFTPLGDFTEVEYLKYLHDQGRCSIGKETGVPFREIALSLGRRAGKSILSSVLILHELDSLLTGENLHQRYGLLSGSNVHLGWLGYSKEASDYSREEIFNVIQKVPYLQKHMVKANSSKYGFRRDDQGFSEIQINCKSCMPNGLRGHTWKLVVLDEVDFFRDSQNTYNCVAPSTSMYNPRDSQGNYGPNEGRVVLISSPNPKPGLLHKIFHQGMKNPTYGCLSLQIPTWEMNSSVNLIAIRDRMGSERFDLEFGAQLEQSHE